MADVEITFGADAGAVEGGVGQAMSAIKALQDQVKTFGEQMDGIGSLTARQVGSVASLFNRLGSAAGFALGPVGILATELVRASQHFEEFENAGQALEAIGASLYKAITNPLTIAIGVIVAAGLAFKAFLSTATGPEAVSAEQALKDMSALIKEIGDRWKTAGEAAKLAMEETAASLRAGVTETLAEAQDSLTAELAKIQENVRGAIADLADLPDVANAPFFDALQEIAINGHLTADQITNLRNTLDQMVVDNPTNEALVHLAATFDKTTDSASQLIKLIAALQAQQEQIAEAGAGGTPTVGELVPTGSRFADFDENSPIKKLQADLKALQAPEIKIDTADAKERIGELNKQIQEFYAAQKQVTAQWDAFFTAAVSAIDRTVSGLINGTLTWKQAFLQTLDVLWQALVSVLEKMLVKWLTTEAMKLAASQQAIVAQIAATEAGEAVQSGIIGEHLIAEILASARGVFAGIFSFLAPVLGPAAAGPATAGAATVAAAATAIPLATGAWDIPSTMLAMLHPGETVLPAPFADAFRSAIGGGGGSAGGGGDVHIHLSAIDTRTGAQFLRENAGEIAKAIQSEVRRMNSRLKPAWAGGT